MLKIDFDGINRAALANAMTLLARWLPDGKAHGGEWIAHNPRRTDKRLGSFKINISTGLWADFASGDRGRDLISLAAYLHCDGNQGEAARQMAEMLGVELYVD